MKKKEILLKEVQITFENKKEEEKRENLEILESCERFAVRTNDCMFF